MRLPSRLIVDLMLRSAQAAGGHAMVLAHGDDHGGTVLVQCRDRDTEGPVLERDFDGHWRAVSDGGDGGVAERDEYLARRRRVDPDIWIVELDIPEAPQFVARMTFGG